MTEKSVVKFSTPYFENKASDNSTETVAALNDYGYTPLQIASLLCFLVGSIHVNNSENENTIYSNK